MYNINVERCENGYKLFIEDLNVDGLNNTNYVSLVYKDGEELDLLKEFCNRLGISTRKYLKPKKALKQKNITTNKLKDILNESE